MPEYQTIKIKASTLKPLRVLAATTGESMMNLVDRLVREEAERISTMQTNTYDRNDRIAVIREALDALRRGVQEPTIVDQDGRPEYVPGAYLTDISFTGSRNVIMTIEVEHFGPEFNLESDDLDEAAEFAADHWEWTVEKTY